MLTIEIDHLKHINNTYGSPVGDEVLRALGSCLREAVRLSDVLGRLDGGKVAILLPETDLSSATKLAERLSTEIEQMKIVHGQMTITVVIIIGTAELTLDATAIKLQTADKCSARLNYRASTVMSSKE